MPGQGGGFDTDMKQKNTSPPIKIEADNGLKNTRGTVAMARTSDPNSATSQFFINLRKITMLEISIIEMIDKTGCSFFIEKKRGE